MSAGRGLVLRWGGRSGARAGCWLPAEATRDRFGASDTIIWHQPGMHQDWSLVPEGERMLAWAKAHTGELTESLTILEGLAATYSRVGKGSRMAGFQVDRYIGIRCCIPFLAWVSGRPDHAAAIALLSPVNQRFGEGFATRDLLAAAGLLRRARGLPA